MPFNPDFSSANDAISKASWIFMQDWLGRQGSQRSQEYLEKQGETWAEQARLSAELEEARQGRQSADTLKRLDAEFVNWAAQQPEAKALMSVIQRKRMMGVDPASEMDQLKQLYVTAGPHASRLTEKYETDPSAMFSLQGFFEPSQAASITEQAMRNRQAGAELGFKWSELGFNKFKKAQEGTDKTVDRYLKKVGDLRTFLEGSKKVKTKGPTSGGLPSETFEDAAPDVKARIDDTLSQLGEIESRMIAQDPDDPLTKEDIAWIDQNWNLSMKAKAQANAETWYKQGRKDPETGEVKFYESYDDAANDAIAEAMAEEGKLTRKRGVIGTPIDERLYEDSEGEFTFSKETPLDVKKQIYAVYRYLKTENKELSGSNVFAAILDAYPALSKYLSRVTKGGESFDEEEPEAPATTPKKKTDAKAGK